MEDHQSRHNHSSGHICIDQLNRKHLYVAFVLKSERKPWFQHPSMLWATMHS